jgi:hypothetical protein
MTKYPRLGNLQTIDYASVLEARKSRSSEVDAGLSVTGGSEECPQMVQSVAGQAEPTPVSSRLVVRHWSSHEESSPWSVLAGVCAT